MFRGQTAGNLFKVYCGELGPGTLQRRVGADGDDSGRQYRSKNADDATYRLKSYSDAPNATSYDDLAQLCRAIDGTGLPVEMTDTTPTRSRPCGSGGFRHRPGMS